MTVLQELTTANVSIRLNPTVPGQFLVKGIRDESQKHLIADNRDEIAWELLPDDVRTETEAEPTEAWLTAEFRRLRAMEVSVGMGGERYEVKLRRWIGALSAFESESMEDVEIQEEVAS